MYLRRLLAVSAGLLLGGAPCPTALAGDAATSYDPALAASTGADEYGMRHYVFVLLETGATPVPEGPQRDAMFKGHFENMKRLAAEGKLVLAGPLDKVDGWRGLFIFAVTDIEEASKLVATDPAVSSGELVPEFHKYYGSAALMLVNGLHEKLARQSF